MFFKRKDGQIDKNVDIFERIMPIIMKERNDALVYMKKKVPLDGMNEYIKKKKQEGIDISHMEIIFTALARVIKEKLKFKFKGNEKTEVVSKMIKEEVSKIRNNTNNNTEDFVDKLKNIPTIVLKIAINTLMFLDKINLLPKSIIDLSPFHSSIFVTNVGSIGLDTIYHHIYNFGTVRNLFINREKERKNKNNRRRN